MRKGRVPTVARHLSLTDKTLGRLDSPLQHQADQVRDDN